MTDAYDEAPWEQIAPVNRTGELHYYHPDAVLASKAVRDRKEAFKLRDELLDAGVDSVRVRVGSRLNPALHELHDSGDHIPESNINQYNLEKIKSRNLTVTPEEALSYSVVAPVEELVKAGIFKRAEAYNQEKRLTEILGRNYKN